MKKETEIEIPQKYRLMVGTTQKFSGGLFSRKPIEPTEFEILGIRWGSSNIVNLKTMKQTHPTFELLLINSSMKRARWSRPFPIREIKLQ